MAIDTYHDEIAGLIVIDLTSISIEEEVDACAAADVGSTNGSSTRDCISDCIGECTLL